mmetsp:Transcript_54109/g.160505  ORF Transcript_54109/g.160505 Transcript_54109/m.160505 type:complete len:259 (-) Transcript_54109:188-964(-)
MVAPRRSVKYGTHTVDEMKQNEMIVCPVEGKCSRIDLDVACGAWEDAFDVHLGYLSVCQRLQRLRHAGRRGAPVCRPKLQDRCSHLWCQARRIEAKCIYHPTFELVNPTVQNIPDDSCRRHRVRSSHKENRWQLPFQPKPRKPSDQQQTDRGQPQEDKEQVHPVRRAAKSKGDANCLAHVRRITIRPCYRRHVARLDYEDAHVDKNESQFRNRHEHSILFSSQWPHRQVEHEEGNADKNGHQHTSLLKRLADQQKPAS